VKIEVLTWCHIWS